MGEILDGRSPNHLLSVGCKCEMWERTRDLLPKYREKSRNPIHWVKTRRVIHPISGNLFAIEGIGAIIKFHQF